jgi:hypothetical protein
MRSQKRQQVLDSNSKSIGSCQAILAAEHQSAKEQDLSELFWALHECFQTAMKPLNFIAKHYLHYKKHKPKSGSSIKQATWF